MAGPILTRKIQWLAEEQAVEGTAETLVAADGKMRVAEGLVPDAQLPKERRNIARASLTPFGALASTEALAVAVQCEMNTPDTITAEPEFYDTAAACAHRWTTIDQIGIGAVTGGPYVRNETITGGTSGATGRLVKEAATGDGLMYLEVLSGTFQSGETLTGGTSGATATSSSAATDAGWSLRPTSSSFKSITGRLEVDGYQWTGRDMMGSMSFEVEASRAGMLTFAMTGPLESEGDQTLTPGVSQDTDEPPILQQAQGKIGSFTPKLRSLAFDQQGNVVLRPDANASGTSGFIASRVTSRDPMTTWNIEMPLAADYDIYADFRANTKKALQARLGVTAGKTVWFFADEAQIMSITPSDEDGIMMAEVQFTLTGGTTTDQEYELLLI